MLRFFTEWLAAALYQGFACIVRSVKKSRGKFFSGLDAGSQAHGFVNHFHLSFQTKIAIDNISPAKASAVICAFR